MIEEKKVLQTCKEKIARKKTLRNQAIDTSHDISMFFILKALR